MASIVLLLTAVWLLIQTTPVQNWLIDKVTSRLSKDLKTKIEINRVDFSLFDKMNLQGVLILDRQKDTILSAGEITVNITDWFFFKNDIELKYIGLRDAYVNLQRSDSVWRHQFILDYFTTPASPKKKKNAINLALREVDLKNILVRQRDGWIGQDMTLSLASLNTVSRNVDFKKRLIEIKSLNINQPYFALRNYDGKKPPKENSAVPIPVVTDTSDIDVNDNKWKILVSTLSLRNGTFKNDNDSRPLDTSAFDGKHIEFSKINGDFRSVKWEMDTVSASIKLATKERSGFEVKHLIADAKFTPTEMTFDNLDIRTNDSHLTNYFSMRFDRFSDMSDFEEKVRMEGRFDNTEINSDDIAYFAPDLKTWKKRIKISGNVKGPVASLIGKNLDIRAGANTHFLGDATITGLPEINSTYLDIKANEFKTVYADATAFIPPLKRINTIDLSKLGYVVFNGNFSGFINDFVTYGTIQTGLGTVKADVNLKLQNAAYPIYSGTVSTQGLNLGPLLKDKNLGYVSLNATLKGAGFNPNSGAIALDARVKFIDYKKYRYQNITLDGELNKKIFDGSIIINDPNAALNLNGFVNFSNKVPEFNFLANIDTLNLYNTQLFRENLAFSGKVIAEFTGNTIDDFLGYATITEASLTRNGFPLSFDSLSINSTVTDSATTKHLSIASNEFSVDIDGVFNIRDLPNSVTAFLNRYYPAYIKKPKDDVPKQSFTFDIKTNSFNEFATIIDSSLQGFDNSRISGSINTNLNNLSLDVNVPYFKYRQFSFSNTDIDATGTYDSLTLYGSVSNIGVTDSLEIQLATFNIKAHNDVSEVSIFTGAEGNKTLDQARLNAIVNTYDNGVGIQFNPSSFMLNGKTWSIEDKGELEFRKNAPAHGLLVLRVSTQEIRVETMPSDVGSWNDAAITLRNINLGDIGPYLLPRNRLEGLIDAHVLIENPGKEMKISSRDFVGKGIRLDNDSIGDLGATMIFDMLTQELEVNGKTLGSDDKSLAYDIHLYLQSQETQANNVISLKPNHFDLKYVDRFLNSLFSDLTGDITGDFQVKGPFNSIAVVGKGRLHNAGLKVKFTQCYYKIEDRDIELSENEINLDGIVLKDTITDNPVYLRGSILHNAFSDMFFDITVSTRKPGTRDARNNRPVQVLNTTFADNKLFYGKVKATGSFVLVGPEDNSYMKIDAIASDQEESSFTIASASSYAGKMPDWLVERKYGEEVTDSLVDASEQSNMVYELDVTANPKVLMKFVMDDLTGDQIVGRGYGTLNIRSGTTEPLAIKGRLDIEEGTYNYTFKSFFPKPFEIIKGTENYISWTGDPLKANMNIQAKYKAERVSFAPLAGINIDQSYANTRENVYVYATLTGQLFQPEFKFELQLDPNSRYNNDFNVTNALQQIERSQTEVTRQVTYLIVFNSFAPPQTGVSNIGIGAAVNELTYNTISSLSGLLFNEVNKKLNTALASLLGHDVRLSFSGSVYNRNVFGVTSNNFNINQANVSGALLVPLFKDRFVISLGSSLEVPLQSTLQQTVQFLPDVTAEWLLNASGTIRLNLFYRKTWII
ncbi:translocation/assembly module TamB domain-containing protein [Niabella ginsengisoli]|uniref:Translocation/assembly module TamB n=1 Tax=Niabella ginsengisoli TaxID=522298 RepID=A0ABS9SQY1_9BACT|nr:translocation/assembly module TamB [Niabella ginsengisoli]MCH5600803.1 translocation/assembly module TamB [Niabella ginsengisoli]